MAERSGNEERSGDGQSEINAVVDGTHHDPHQLLGPHDRVVRAYRPGAVGMKVLLGEDKVVPMEAVHKGGVFEAQVPDGARYRLEADYGGGTVHSYEDPYRFWPTLGEDDLHLIGEGRHWRLWKALGAHLRTHQDVAGTSFAVWAPSARSVQVVGDFNFWDGRAHQMRSLGSSGVWELFVPGVEAGAPYKYRIVTPDGETVLKADPVAFGAEQPPRTSSVVSDLTYEWDDDEWITARDGQEPPIERPLSIYEVHVGSWRRVKQEDDRPLTYLELAEQLPDYVTDMGFTHVEFMPLAEHPFTGSWGYQVSSYFAPMSRPGPPRDFKVLVDALHQRGIGVIVDWVPGHFPRDEFALARFDGTALYEHEDPRLGYQPEWGTLVFNFGRHEVRNFLVANALYWLEEFHLDGLRVDGVASVLYLDYGREEGEWLPNDEGGNENMEGVDFLKQLNEIVYGAHPGVVMVAEESTAWPGVSTPISDGGLGFGFKWNMGWMHDTLEYFAKEPIHRSHHHGELAFGLEYAFSENFVLPLSHDEVVHGKGSLVDKMPGDDWQKVANLRALLAWMWAHPGKQLLCMGAELAQWREWSEERSLDWDLLDDRAHGGVQELVRRLNRVYTGQPALFQRDSKPEGFRWIDASDAESNVFSFLRMAGDGSPLACVANLSPVPRHDYRIGLPAGGAWHELLNTDDLELGGSGVGNAGQVWANDAGDHGFPYSADVTLPPLGVVWLVPEEP
ncbi:MAG: 1,4-alpha-glucan branching protein GlgB [Actinomycetota bacterium]|nr:1,4-alpha-glucan branching protein GlgB [Actinomycetota bacterium]